jgi:membrane fusion protein, multidrug efflux system
MLLTNKIRSINVIAALAAVTIATQLGACSDSAPAATTPPATPVRAAMATTGPAQPPILTNGLVVTKDEMRLSFKVGGVIRRISVEEGTTIKRGQRLAEIELTEVNSQVEQARQLAEKARRDLARGESLYKDQVISLEQLQDLRTQSALSNAQLKSASFNLGYAVITAPRDGVVLRKLAEERELVPAGQPVLVVGAQDRGYVVRLGLADREIVQLKLGDLGEIRMDAFPNKMFPGTVSELASAADERTGLFPVEMRFEEAPPRLVSGLVAKIRIVPAAGQAESLTYVPIASVVEADGSKASVFVIDGERALKRDVQVAFIAPDAIALTSGLKPGEQVVTDGALYLENEERIEIVRDGAQAVGSVESTQRPANSAS